MATELDVHEHNPAKLVRAIGKKLQRIGEGTLLTANSTATNPAPARLAVSPITLTAPDVPAGTTLPVVIRRGGEVLRRPSSELQVSAVAAAIPAH